MFVNCWLLICAASSLLFIFIFLTSATWFHQLLLYCTRLDNTSASATTLQMLLFNGWSEQLLILSNVPGIDDSTIRWLLVQLLRKLIMFHKFRLDVWQPDLNDCCRFVHLGRWVMAATRIGYWTIQVLFVLRTYLSNRPDTGITL